jgi:IS30 family transposase
MKKQYIQLTLKEREMLHIMIWDKLSIREMARRLGRSPSTISREIERNTPEQRRVYMAHLAQGRYETRKKVARIRPRLKDQAIVDFVEEQLKEDWSPEQIAGRWNKLHKKLTISHEAIYQYIYLKTKPGAEGDLRVYLKRKHKNRNRKTALFPTAKTIIKNRVSIDLRPAVVEHRKEIGHWEGDSIVSSKSPAGLNTLAERKSRLVRISKLQRKTAAETSKAVVSALGRYPEKIRQTLTMDNGTENAGHQTMTEQIGIACYFAHPYHSWERGTNENTNGLIRYYFPKGTDFTKITDEEIKRVEDKLNNRPRKCLKYLTPNEVFSKAVAVRY